MATDRKDQAVWGKLERRMFADPDVKALLAEVPDEVMVSRFGQPHTDTHYATAPGWTQGDPRPMLADEDPAVMQAIGRCAASRLRNDATMALLGAIHPTACGYCEYPLPELLAACSWSVWSSGLVLSETLTWAGADGSHYTRPGRHNEYTNPVHAGYWALPRHEREYRMQGVLAASRM